MPIEAEHYRCARAVESEDEIRIAQSVGEWMRFDRPAARIGGPYDSLEHIRCQLAAWFRGNPACLTRSASDHESYYSRFNGERWSRAEEIV